MTSRVGTKGQVVIPQQLRRQFGIKPGDEVEFFGAGDHVAVRLVSLRTPLLGRFSGDLLTEDLERARTAEREEEDRL